MKYGESGIKHNFENSGVVLAWIQSEVIKSNFTESTVYQSRNALTYAELEFKSCSFHSVSVRMPKLLTNFLCQVLFNDTWSVKINGCCFVSFSFTLRLVRGKVSCLRHSYKFLFNSFSFTKNIHTVLFAVGWYSWTFLRTFIQMSCQQNLTVSCPECLSLKSLSENCLSWSSVQLYF